MASAREMGKAVVRGLGPVATRVGPQAAGGMLRRVIELAIDGYGKLPSARAVAARQLERNAGSVDEAIEALINHHVRLASAQGFVTNLGGLPALPVSIPANLTGVAVVQVRMIATIAHLRGYDIDDGRVRTAMVMCLLGGEQVGKRIALGKLPTSPMVIATAPMFDPELDSQVAQEVVADLLARVSGKRAALMITKRVPLVGGGVGAVLDGITTYQIGKYAKGELVRRRAILS